MLFFAHTGITVDLFWLFERSMIRQRALSIQHKPPAGERGGGSSLVEKTMPALDYRYLLVGSILPDLIDKPLGIYIFRESLSNGRIFGHTLLSAVVLLGAGWFLYTRRRRIGLFCLGLVTAAHLVLDETVKLYPVDRMSNEEEEVYVVDNTNVGCSPA